MKTPEEAFFASEEAEVGRMNPNSSWPMESEVFCRREVRHSIC